MTEVWFTKPLNRLRWRAGLKGVTRREAVARAEANLEGIRLDVIEDIDRHLSLLNTVFSHAAGDAPPIAELYETSGAIVAIAGVVGFDGLGKAAFSLCELLSEFEASGCWCYDPVRVHIDAMGMLRQLNESSHEEEIKTLIHGLTLLLSHFGPKSDFLASIASSR